MLFFLLLILLFRSICHQVSNQADKLKVMCCYIHSNHKGHCVVNELIMT